MGFFSSLIGDVGELFSDTASNLGEMGGNIVGGTLEGLQGALRDPTFVKGALAMAGLTYFGPGMFTDPAGNLFTAEQATGMAGVTPAEIASTFGGAAPASMSEFAVQNPGFFPGAESTVGVPEAAANTLAPTAAAGANAGANTLADLSWMDTASPSQLEAANALPGASGVNFTQLATLAKQYGVPLSTLASSLLGASTAKSAAQTQADAQQRANDLMYKMYQEQVGLQAPFRQAGLTAQNRMLDLLGLSNRTGAAGYGLLNKPFGMEQFQADPGYAFRLGEGVKALERSRAAAGGLLSGGTGKALTRYGQDLGSQEYGNAFSRYQTERANQLNPLAALTAAGQGATNVLGTAAGRYGTQAGEGITDIARAQAAGNVGMSNALAGGVGQYLGYMQNQNMADAIRQSQYRPY